MYLLVSSHYTLFSSSLMWDNVHSTISAYFTLDRFVKANVTLERLDATHKVLIDEHIGIYLYKSIQPRCIIF